MGTEILVSNLDQRATEEELRDLFSNFGEVWDVIKNDQPDEGIDTFSAIVTMVDEEEAHEAVESLDGHLLHKRGLELSFMDESLNDAFDDFDDFDEDFDGDFSDSWDDEGGGEDMDPETEKPEYS